MSTHALHRNHTGRNECSAVALRQLTQEKCSNCQSLLNAIKPAFHCSQCNFSLCASCDRGYRHPVHLQHVLYFVNPAQESGGGWRCDVCKKSNLVLEEKMKSYHCRMCSFNMCKSCFQPVSRPLHEHMLIRTDVRSVYRQSGGAWCCDNCQHNNGPGHYYPRHCETCQFDLCDNCCKSWTSPLHPHQLFKANPMLVYRQFDGGWSCDNCHKKPNYGSQPYHCPPCTFDLCEDCVRSTGPLSNQVGFDVPRSHGFESAVQSFFQGRFSSLTHSGESSPTTSRGNPVASPQEDVLPQIGRPGPPAEDEGQCVICLDRPKDATIVHGSTGHVCCCTVCALELERKGSHCPICRAPIDRVIKQYTV